MIGYLVLFFCSFLKPSKFTDTGPFGCKNKILFSSFQLGPLQKHPLPPPLVFPDPIAHQREPTCQALAIVHKGCG